MQPPQSPDKAWLQTMVQRLSGADDLVQPAALMQRDGLKEHSQLRKVQETGMRAENGCCDAWLKTKPYLFEIGRRMWRAAERQRRRRRKGGKEELIPRVDRLGMTGKSGVG